MLKKDKLPHKDQNMTLAKIKYFQCFKLKILTFNVKE